MFYVYGFDLSDRIWQVLVVMTSVVAYLFGCVFSTILGGPPYIIPFLLYHLSKQHRDPGFFFNSFICFFTHHSLAWHFVPSAFALFILLQMNTQNSQCINNLYRHSQPTSIYILFNSLFTSYINKLHAHREASALTNEFTSRYLLS
jgi:hypothetical protein